MPSRSDTSEAYNVYWRTFTPSSRSLVKINKESAIKASKPKKVVNKDEAIAKIKAQLAELENV